MTGISFEVITFVCAFGGALLGMYIRTRLPPAHLIKESDDVISARHRFGGDDDGVTARRRHCRS